MTELIKGLAHVRDGLTLIAFLCLVLLVAFRTKKVPELFFGSEPPSGWLGGSRCLRYERSMAQTRGKFTRHDAG